jgi:hypothetical protein
MRAASRDVLCVWHASQAHKRMLGSSSRRDSPCRAGSMAEGSSDNCLLAAHLCVVVQVLEVSRGHGPGDPALTDRLKSAGDNTEAQIINNSGIRGRMPHGARQQTAAARAV